MFLARALLVSKPDRPELRRLAQLGLRWPRVVRLAKAAAVLGTVYQSIVDQGLTELVSSDALRAMQEYAENNSSQNLLLLHEGATANALLRANGIEAIALKGTALLTTVYPSLSFRHTDDVDLLVPEEQAHAASKVLRDNGFQFTWEFKGPFDPSNQQEPTGPRVRRHLPPLVSPRGVVCELHTTVAKTPDESLSYASLWARSRTIDWQGHELRIPCVADSVAIGCLHVMDSHETDPRYFPRHLVDLHLLASHRTGGDSPRCQHSPRACEAVRHCQEMLAQLEQFAPNEIGSTAPPLPAAARFFVPSVSRADVAERARIIRALLKDPRRLARLAFPPAAYMAQRYGKGNLVTLYARRLVESLIPPGARPW